MNIQFVRLEDDICGLLNRMALQQHRTVSDLVNQLLRDQLAANGEFPVRGECHPI